MKRFARITVEFAYTIEEDIDRLIERVEDKVMEVVDPDCSGEVPCPRDWSIHTQYDINIDD